MKEIMDVTWNSCVRENRIDNWGSFRLGRGSCYYAGPGWQARRGDCYSEGLDTRRAAVGDD